MMPNLLSLRSVDLIAVLLSQPLFSLVIASAIGAITLLFVSAQRVRHQEHPVHAAPAAVGSIYDAELRALRVAALVVVVSLIVENLTATFTPPPGDAVSWWRYAAPLLAALVGLATLLTLITLRGSTPPHRPFALAGRRTWTTFGSRRALAGTGAAVLALTATTVAAGAASSPDPAGRYVWLEIPVANTAVDPVRLTFYGWAYGIPVLICLAGLSIVAIAVLQVNAARPFRSPETLVAERRSRSAVASGTLRLTAAATLLALAAAWRFIAEVGTASGLVIDGDGGPDAYDLAWKYAEFARYAGWGAPVLEVVAFLLMLALIVRRARPRTRTYRDEVVAATAPQDGR